MSRPPPHRRARALLGAWAATTALAALSGCGSRETSAPPATVDSQARAEDTAPVRPTTTDSDGDGVGDDRELLDGTDPADPRSARAFHPEITGWPRLYFGPEALPALRARAQAVAQGQGSIADTALYAQVRAASELTPPEQPVAGPFDPTVASARAHVAVAAAFRALVEQDPSMADKAAALLTSPFPDPLTLKSVSPLVSKADLHDAETLVDLCAALDHLAGSGLADEALPVARARLQARLAAVDALHLGTPAYKGVLMLATNNHVMKFLAARGLCAIALPDRPDAAAAFNEALTGLLFVLHRHQGTPEGGYAEGWNYLSYGGQSFLPLLLAVHRLFTTGVYPSEGAQLRGLGTLTAADALKGQLQKVPDPALHPTTVAIYDAALRSARPDGLTVPTDDANPSPLHGALLAALLGDGRYLHNHALPAVAHYAGRQPSLSFALYPTDLEPLAPSGPLDFALPEAGFAVLRTAQGPDGLFVHLLAEHGAVRAHGLGHEQADPLSFLVHAFGEALVLDPGYINWDHHDLVRRGKDHNLVLVQGQGPPLALDGLLDFAPPDEGFITDLQTHPGWAAVGARARYLKTSLTRRLLRVDGRWLAVADTMRPDEAAGGAVQYTFQLNGHGGGSTPQGSFEPLADGGRWSRPKASLRARVVALSGEATAVGWRPEEHATTWGQWATHACLEVTAAMGDRAGFLTLLLPVAQGQPEPPSILWRAADGVAAGAVADPDVPGARDAVVLNQTEKTASVTIEGAVIPAPPGLSLWRVQAGAALLTAALATPAGD